MVSTVFNNSLESFSGTMKNECKQKPEIETDKIQKLSSDEKKIICSCSQINRSHIQLLLGTLGSKA